MHGNIAMDTLLLLLKLNIIFLFCLLFVTLLNASENGTNIHRKTLRPFPLNNENNNFLITPE